MDADTGWDKGLPITASNVFAENPLVLSTPRGKGFLLWEEQSGENRQLLATPVPIRLIPIGARFPVYKAATERYFLPAGAPCGTNGFFVSWINESGKLLLSLIASNQSVWPPASATLRTPGRVLETSLGWDKSASRLYLATVEEVSNAIRLYLYPGPVEAPILLADSTKEDFHPLFPSVLAESNRVFVAYQLRPNPDAGLQKKDGVELVVFDAERRAVLIRKRISDKDTAVSFPQIALWQERFF
ncbi:MAG: hypothetical protein JNM63_04110, partial [Spirochaetia bacterium]|nr:hypothetical protein [Spirochaetia bacterium]